MIKSRQSPGNGAVWRTCQYSARATLHDMERGIRNLQIIAYAAPFVGLLTALEGALWQVQLAMLSAYGGCVAGHWTETLIPFAFSLALSAALIMGHGILTALLECFRLELKAATLQLTNDLTLVRHPRP
jgi:hypothetical protein